MNRPLRLAVLLSGSGTTLAEPPRPRRRRPTCPPPSPSSSPATPPPSASAAPRRPASPPPSSSARPCRSREEFSRRIFDHCRAAGADLVCLAGFLQLLQIPDDFLGRVLNIHPALIPAFSGKGFHGRHVHEAALEAGVKVSGCTVHFADNEYDHGPIVLQRVVPVLDDDTPETLAARVFEQECEAYPEAIRLFAQGRLRDRGPARARR